MYFLYILEGAKTSFSEIDLTKDLISLYHIN